MTKEEQIGAPPVEVMRQLLDENRALVRLLSADAIIDDIASTELEPAAGSDAANALVSAYRELLALLEIISATSARRIDEEVSGQ